MSLTVEGLCIFTSCNGKCVVQTVRAFMINGSLGSVDVSKHSKRRLLSLSPRQSHTSETLCGGSVEKKGGSAKLEGGVRFPRRSRSLNQDTMVQMCIDMNSIQSLHYQDKQCQLSRLFFFERGRVVCVVSKSGTIFWNDAMQCSRDGEKKRARIFEVKIVRPRAR